MNNAQYGANKKLIAFNIKKKKKKLLYLHIPDR